jgi:GntR family transcriptional regulator
MLTQRTPANDLGGPVTSDPFLSSTTPVSIRTRPAEASMCLRRSAASSPQRRLPQALEREGLVVVRPRRGRVVRSNQRLRWHLSEFERPDHTVLTTSDAWETDIESQGHDPTRQDLQVERITPPEAIASRLNLDPRTDICVVRRHVRYIDGKPAILSDDYFDEKIVQGTELAAPEDTTRENILAEAGYEQAYDIDEIITRMPTPDEVDRLHGGRQASPRDDLDNPRRRADLAVHHPDLDSGSPQVRCALEVL